MSVQYNQYEIQTPNGLKEFSLHQADILNFEHKTDILILSAGLHSYYPRHGTMIEAVENALHINVGELARSPLIDLRAETGGAWAARLTDCPFSYLVCINMSKRSIYEDVDQGLHDCLHPLFLVLELLDRIDSSIRSAIMPLIGTGAQHIRAELVLSKLFTYGCASLSNCRHLQQLYIVERKAALLPQINEAMNTILHRDPAVTRDLFREEGLKPKLRLLDDMVRCMRESYSFLQENETLRDLQQALSTESITYLNMALFARKLCETVLSYMEEINQNQDLGRKITDVNRYPNRLAPPWLVSYMHVLRTLGNERVHDSDGQVDPTYPLPISEKEHELLLLCMIRILDFLRFYLESQNDTGFQS